MKTLYLLRHAEADRQDQAVSDYDRPLATFGIEAARQVGRTMYARGWLPQAVLCSAARRAVETWEMVAPEITVAAKPQSQRELYLAPPARLITALRGQSKSIASILLIGHNPGIGGLARALAGPGSAAPAKSRLRRGYPTATLGVVSLAIDEWAAIRPEDGRLLHLLYPSDPD